VHKQSNLIQAGYKSIKGLILCSVTWYYCTKANIHIMHGALTWNCRQFRPQA